MKALSKQGVFLLYSLCWLRTPVYGMLPVEHPCWRVRGRLSTSAKQYVVIRWIGGIYALNLELSSVKHAR